MAVCKCPKCGSTSFSTVSIGSRSNKLNRKCKSCGEYYYFDSNSLKQVEGNNRESI